MVRVLNTGVAPAQEIMDLDARLLETLDPGAEAILHHYLWDGPSATYGYFIDPEQYLDLAAVSRRGLSLARRPTGGGIVFHIWDLAFSLLMPAGHPRFSSKTLDNYRFVNQAVLEVVQEMFCQEPALTAASFPSLGPSCSHFCMARPTQYDVVFQGMKVAGAAQRRRKQGYLHQGTISLAFPDLEVLSDLLLSREEVLQAMASYTFAPLGNKVEAGALVQLRAQLADRLTEKFKQLI